MTTNKQNLLDAMKDFKDSYNALLLAIDSYEVNDKTSVNDLPEFIENYPFDKSFDELAIGQWVDNVIRGTQQLKFTVLDYTYLNTGGNCMVGIFEVWLPADNRVVYALTNEEGCTLAAVDYISNELAVDDYDEVMLDYVDWGRVTGHEKYFELYRYCLNVYTLDDCKFFGYTRELPYYLLSDELQSQITSDYKQWAEANEHDTFNTDGKKIIVHPDYEAVTAEQEWLNAIEAFKHWHNTTAGVEDLYSEEYKLSFAGHHITLPYNADVWDAVDTLLDRTIQDW